jgi:class 3 adenylate cyclase/tetratricopeptide (TPR) repeat protein
MAVSCGSCGTENPERARFCMSCGQPLARRCPACAAEAPPQARFCMECGTSLGDAPEAAPSPSPAAGPAALHLPAAESSQPTLDGGQLPEERRTVTVLFADLSGYTAVAEQMDPEAVKGLVDRSLQRLGQEVERYGGTVDKYIGDNVMALFGAPVAHEDDAERAVRAALGMQQAMGELNAELEASHDVALALRVGLNTGEVLAGAVGDRRYTVIGDTVNVAARLQAAGRPGSVTVGEATWLETREAIEYRELEPLALKGKANPVPAWEAVALRAATPVRRDVSTSSSPLVGRDTELALLGSLYAQVERERRPQLVTIVGEAGVGKSRLLAELELGLALREPNPKVRQGRCLPYGSALAYWALGEVVRAEAGIVDRDGSDVAWEKLCRFVSSLAGDDAAAERSEAETERMAALIGRMLGMDVPDGHEQALGGDPQRIREAFFSAIRWGIETMARREPVVLAFEDIHWADDGMLDLIEFLAQWVRAPLLIVCLARDDLLERRHSWGGGRIAATSILLEPLTTEESRQLVTALLPPERQTPEAIDLVADRSGGNPLFVEEMAHLVGGEDAGADRLPTTVHAVLAARLDSLDRFARRLVQHAAVAGRTFWEGWLVEFARDEGGDLAAALASLEEKEIVVPGDGVGTRLAGERELAFRHVLIRDVAYGMLPKAVRARKHSALGEFLEERSGERAEEVVGLIAEHYSRAAVVGREAGLPPDELEPVLERALRFLVAAGDAAAARYSNTEALAHYRMARELGAGGDAGLLASVGEREGDVCLRLGRVDAAISLWQGCLDHQRSQEDLVRVGELHRKLGGALWHKGERRGAIEHYQRGINLLKDGPASAELVRLYEDAAALYLHTGDNMLAVFAAEKALGLAEKLGETRAASRAHGIFGRVFGRIGDMDKARENLERSVDLARAADEAGTVGALLALGRHLEIADADHAGARAAYGEALALAERIGDLPARVELHAQLAQLAAQRGEWDEAERAAAQSAALAEREGLVGKLCFPLALQGLLAWRRGDFERAERRARDAHELADQAGWSEVSYAALSTLALALRDRGDLDAALGALERALDLCERAGFLPQSVHALAERALVQCVAGRMEEARGSAAEAAELAARLRYPAGEAAALEARGLTSAEPEEGVRLLRDALERWGALDRPLERARCSLVLAHVLQHHDPERARDALAAAGAELERLGIAHLARKASAEAIAAP